MKVVAILGSISKKSYNRKLAKYMKERYKDKLDIEILTLENIPMYNEDIELTPPNIIIEYREKIKNSDGLIFITPEYNHSIPGVLKNAIDWFSRVEKVMVNKPGMIVGASMGMLGTVKAQIHLRQILNSPGVGVITLPGNEVFIGNVIDKMDEEGNLTHKPTIEFLDQVVDNFIEWINRINN